MNEIKRFCPVIRAEKFLENLHSDHFYLIVCIIGRHVFDFVENIPLCWILIKKNSQNWKIIQLLIYMKAEKIERRPKIRIEIKSKIPKKCI